MKRNSLYPMFLGLVMAATPARAVITSITVSDSPGGDVLSIPEAPFADEIGLRGGGFPIGERVFVTLEDIYTGPDVCSNMPNNPLIEDWVITIRNAQSFQLGRLYYVVNGQDYSYPAGGTFGNYDGLINGAQAMMIDSVGFNRPLLSESILADGIMQGYEIWTFVVQDYEGSPTPGWFGTAAVGGSSLGILDTNPSLVIPEPAGLALSLLGGLLMLRRRR